MQFKKSANVFVSGLVLSFLGNVVGIIAAATASATSSRYYGSNGAAIVLAILGFIVGLVGLILLLVGAYRALVKIDALPVPAPAPAPVAEQPAS